MARREECPIKILFMDVDGTLTDGKIYVSAARRELAKAFYVKDGYAIKELLPQYHIIPVIITGRSSEIVAHRAKELDISEVYQGVHDKLEVMLDVADKYHCSPKDVAYIGDDISDLSCMMQCGLKGCPADAADEVRAVADYICTRRGGEGAVREFIEWMIRRKGISVKQR